MAKQSDKGQSELTTRDTVRNDYAGQPGHTKSIVTSIYYTKTAETINLHRKWVKKTNTPTSLATCSDVHMHPASNGEFSCVRI